MVQTIERLVVKTEFPSAVKAKLTGRVIDYGTWEEFDDEAPAKRITKLQASYVKDSEKRKTYGKPIYLNVKEFESSIPKRNSPTYGATFKTTKGYRFLNNLSEDNLNSLFNKITEKTSNTDSIGMNHSKGIPVGINFQKNQYFSEGEQWGYIIEVHDKNQPLRVSRLSGDGKIVSCYLGKDKLKAEIEYNGRVFENAYAVRGDESNLEKYLVSSNIKAIHFVRKTLIN